MKFVVATIWAYPGRPIEDSPLKQSCDRLGIPLRVLQEGQRYVNSRTNKLVLFWKEMAEADFDCLIYLDGDDLFLTRDPRAEALEAMRHYGCKFLVGADAHCWPCTTRHHDAFPATARCRYPNAGAWVATRAAFHHEFRAMLALSDPGREHQGVEAERLRTHDQAVFGERMAFGPSAMRLDTQQKLILNINSLHLDPRALFLDLANDRLPAVVHGAAQSKSVVRKLWRHLARLSEIPAHPRYDVSDSIPLDIRGRLNSVAGLLDLLRELPPLGRVAEIGCFRGVSTEALALFAREVLAVDTWPDAGVAALFRERLAAYEHVRPLRRASRDAAREIADGALDLVYIDANHSYQAVRSDIAAWLPKVRKGGFLTGHDYVAEVGHLRGVVEAVNERFGKPDRIYADSSWLVQV